MIQVRSILSGQCSRALNPANNVKGHSPAAWKPDACKLARCSIFSVPSALFRVRPTSMLIFRLVVSANYMFRLQEYITSPHRIFPNSYSPRASTTATHRSSIASATHSSTSCFWSNATVSSSTPRTINSRKPLLVSLKHLKSGYRRCLHCLAIYPALSAWVSHPGCFRIDSKHSAIQEIGTCGY